MKGWLGIQIVISKKEESSWTIPRTSLSYCKYSRIPFVSVPPLLQKIKTYRDLIKADWIELNEKFPFLECSYVPCSFEYSEVHVDRRKLPLTYRTIYCDQDGYHSWYINSIDNAIYTDQKVCVSKSLGEFLFRIAVQNEIVYTFKNGTDAAFEKLSVTARNYLRDLYFCAL
jgi:hypothetical protein